MTRYFRRDEVEVALDTAPRAPEDDLEALVDAVTRLRQLRHRVRAAEATVRDLARRIAQEGAEATATTAAVVLDVTPPMAPRAKPKEKPRRRRDSAAGKRIARFIEESFEGGAFEVGTIAENTQTSNDTARHALMRLAKRGVLVRVSYGLYRKA